MEKMKTPEIPEWIFENEEEIVSGFCKVILLVLFLWLVMCMALFALDYLLNTFCL